MKERNFLEQNKGKMRVRERKAIRRCESDCNGDEGETRACMYNNLGILFLHTLTIGPLDVYAAADIDVARTVIHGHLVGLAHRVRHHKTRPASSVTTTVQRGLARGRLIDSRE